MSKAPQAVFVLLFLTYLNIFTTCLVRDQSFFVGYGLKCCVDWENKKNYRTERSSRDKSTIDILLAGNDHVFHHPSTKAGWWHVIRAEEY